MAKVIKLSENEFKLVPAGEDILLKIEKVEGKPKADPEVIQITFAHDSGAKIVNKYDLDKDKAVFAFSCLVRAVLDPNKQDFSVTEDGPAMLDKFVECEVVHNESSQGNTFANIRKTKRTDRVFGESTPSLDTDEYDL